MTQPNDTIGERGDFGGSDLSDEDGTVPGPDNSLQEVTSRIAKAVKAGGGYSAVAARRALPGRTLSNLIGGQEPKYSQLLAIAQATGVRLEWLATGAGPMHEAEAGLLECGADLGGQDLAPQAPGSMLVPRYDARAAAGSGSPFNEGRMVGKVQISGDLLAPHLRRNPAHLALIECMGDSMEPALRDGDYLLVDTSIRNVAAGPIYILRVGDTLLAKRLQPRLDGTVLVISDNPRYPPETVTPSDAHPLEIVGEVIWRSGPLRF